VKLLDLHLGRPITRGGLSLFPVWNGAAVPSRGYDLRSPHVCVSERTGHAVVSELVLTNGGGRPALVLEGELLEGGQQHRVAARSALVGAGQAVVLDVRCVEEGRWHGAGGHVRGGRRAPVAVRAAEDQGRVWDRVRRYEQQYDASGTHSLLDATRRAEARGVAAVQDLRPLPFQAGVLVGIGGQPLLLEAYDSPRTFSHAWDALLRSVALDAVGAPAVATPGRRARRFLERLELLSLEEADAGLGTGIRGRSAYARLDGLVWRRRAVHAVAVNPRHELVAA
jgi:hypothetical protein